MKKFHSSLMKFLQGGCLFLFLFILSFSNSGNNIVQGQCLSDQKALLLQLNHSLYSPDYLLMSSKRKSWSLNTDCCSWDGITCDRVGHIIGLDLSSEGIYGGLDNSSSLFKLLYLERLNLAHNFFDSGLNLADYSSDDYAQMVPAFISAPIPSEIDQLTNLKYLNLSNSRLTGQIPIGISRLTRLVTLDLSSIVNYDDDSDLRLILRDPNLETLTRNLTELKELVLDGVDISEQGSKWCQTLSSSLPKLEVLSLSHCFLSGPIDSSLLKLQSINKLNLSYNSFLSEIPDFLGGLANLVSLDLSYCDLYGKLPQRLLNIRTLQNLYLTNNGRLNGSLPGFPTECWMFG